MKTQAKTATHQYLPSKIIPIYFSGLKNHLKSATVHYEISMLLEIDSAIVFDACHGSEPYGVRNDKFDE